MRNSFLRLLFFVLLALLLSCSAVAATRPDARLEKAYRVQQGGWTYGHLEGSPSDVGFQHGYLLAPEIKDAFDAIKLFDTHQSQHDWEFFRTVAREKLWAHIHAEYQQELQGIADGVKAHDVELDVWDIVALNAFEEVPDYYLPWLNQQQKSAKNPKLTAPGNCSAFIATGGMTKDHQIVIAHNNWTSYLAGERWVVIYDIQPEHGNRILMDGFPGVITSDDDFGVTAAGLMITETTITQFEGWDPNGKPEFVRSRKAMQYASSIDEYVSIMKDGNNGGYANDWLIGDRKTGEIAYLELGLKNTPLWRSKDGYFISSNFARDPDLMKTETPDFDPHDLSHSENARRVTWEKKIAAAKGRIDVALAEQFLADHDDSFTGRVDAASRSLCGHIDKDPKGVPEWDDGPYYPDGAVTGKVTDSDLAGNVSLIAHAGHPCGEDFVAAPFLAAHPEYSYLKPILKDMPSGPWTTFSAGEKK